MGVKAAFDRYAQVYDETRKKFIPCFDDFYGTALDLFPTDREKDLSVHHLEDPEKKRLFSRVFDRFNLGGLFINADQVLGRTRAIDEIYRETWLQQVRTAGITEAELAQGLERMKEDRLAPLESQLAWMDQAGFTEVNLWYKYYNFVGWSGRKEAQ